MDVEAEGSTTIKDAMDSEPAGATERLKGKKGKKGKRSGLPSDRAVSSRPAGGVSWPARLAAPHEPFRPAVLPVASSSREAILQAALLASASGRSFEDVNFFVFSRRRLDGLVDHPLPLLANSTLIRKASSHFDYLFAEGFSESGITDMAAPYPSTRPDSTDEYAYASDSDLEDEEEADDEPFEDPVDEVHCADVVKSAGSDAKDLGGSQLKKTSQPPVIPEKPTSALPGKPGRVVFLSDFAYKTWKAFIFYAYLGEKELSFAPLRSEQKSAPKGLGPDKAPPCSPKSMYRLAEKYDIAPLKQLAAAEIKKRLSTHNILEEVFSTFTSLYADIQTMEVEYLRANMQDPGIQSRLPVWIEAMEDGRLPKGGARIISLLLSAARFGSPGASKMCPAGCTTRLYTCDCGRRF